MNNLLSTFAMSLIVGSCGPEIVPPTAGRPVAPPAEGRVARVDAEPVPWRPVVEPVRAPAISTGSPEVDPLASYLKVLFAEEIRNGGRLVVEDPTDVRHLHDREPYQVLVDRLTKNALDKIPVDLVRDFTRKNSEPRSVWSELGRRLPVDPLTDRESKLLFSGSGDGWKRFYTKFPDAIAIITVSRVGLNRDKTLALFYVGVGRGGLNGYGSLHVLKKFGDEWVELPVDLGFEWGA